MNGTDESLSEIDNQFAHIKLRPGGIVHVHFKKNTTLDLDLQNEMRNVYKNLLNDKTTGFIFSAADGFLITKEAKENFKNISGDSPINAYGIIANNLGYRMVANFFLKFYRPSVPFKLFNKVEEAAHWLLEVQKISKP